MAFSPTTGRSLSLFRSTFPVALSRESLRTSRRYQFGVCRLNSTHTVGNYNRGTIPAGRQWLPAVTSAPLGPYLGEKDDEDSSSRRRIRQTATISSEFDRRKRISLISIANQILSSEQRRRFSQDIDKTGDTPPNPRRKRMNVPNFGPEADKAVLSLQNARKDRARAKTEKNIRRALIGNVVICVAKLGAWMSSGSSSMMSEFVHSVVDCGNQSLLLMGLKDSENEADRLHPYGYGKAVYFWALVSALGTFFLGAGVSMSHAVGELMDPSLQNITKEVWGVLAFSFCVDGYVFWKTVEEVKEDKPNNVPFWDHAMKLRDPATMAVLLEDGAACLGIVIAIAGISASYATAMPVFDGMAGVGISVLLGTMGLALVRVNHRFLLGRGVSRDMTTDIENIIRSRRSIDGVYGIQSQWTGPETFSFKAEVDFDGTYLAAELMPRYRGEFDVAKANFDQELQVLLSWYAEDIIRGVEREVRHIEALIRQKYPGAEFIELEPMSKDADRFAIDDSFEEKLLLIEKEEMKRLIRVLHQKPPEESFPKSTTDDSPDSSDPKP
jgi:zinc transporter 9